MKTLQQDMAITLFQQNNWFLLKQRNSYRPYRGAISKKTLLGKKPYKLVREGPVLLLLFSVIHFDFAQYSLRLCSGGLPGRFCGRVPFVIRGKSF
ncbi:MAG: hypothetical protein HPY78_05850 [Brevinematales bacterium]|nr:hypothetical protein [Brevinematales bacterium]